MQYYHRTHIICKKESVQIDYTALFIKSIIDKNRYRYNYGRAFKKDLIKETIVKLLKHTNGNPDFEFMETYIKQLRFGDRI